MYNHRELLREVLCTENLVGRKWRFPLSAYYERKYQRTDSRALYACSSGLWSGPLICFNSELSSGNEFLVICLEPWVGDWPVARPVPIQDYTNTQKLHSTSLSQIGFQTTVPTFKVKVRSSLRQHGHCPVKLTKTTKMTNILERN